MRSTRVEANGLTFECLVEGDGDRLALCLHGFPDDAGSMAPLQERLADAGFTAVAPYMRGYAPTDPAPDGVYTASELGRDAVALAERLCAEHDLTEPVLVGHDWGAVASYVASVSSPETFERMVTLAVPPRFDALLRAHPGQFVRSWYMWFFQLPDVPERALRWNDYALVEFLWGVWSPTWQHPPERFEAVRETFDTDETLENALEYYRQISGGLFERAVTDRTPAVDDEPHIEVPTLVLHGDEDSCMAPALFEDIGGVFAAGTPHRVVRVAGAGHFLHQERPDVVGEEVVEFLTA
ncbi:alpha/beta fold hydrolase [Salinirubellus salinus]|uniref:Alpha/beta fold hydrolase n=1 Tax=Salinirubellus salinus TaxID=1364945 RepID=A0A9E7R7U3_9EURY|nr:alpha/beta fold hydrolase [Salinirubellus salinus]UWM56694.1 alpha/beta fold hydrolase [Salinirubellus salinus]